MTDRLTLLLCGAEREPPEVAVSSGVSWTGVSPKPLGDLSSGELERLAAESAGEWFAFVDASLQRSASAETISGALAEATAAAVVFPLVAESDVAWAWERFPPRLAGLLASPTADAIVAFHRPALAGGGGFADVSDPIHERLIRLVRDGGAVMSSKASSGAGEHDGTPSASHTASLCALAPERPAAEGDWLLRRLAEVSPRELAGEVHSPPDATALKAGLFQCHDYLDESHALAQSVQGEGRHRAGDYWHAIMHRREPDASNSKYWYRRVGPHPLFEELAVRAADILEDYDDACPWEPSPGDAWDPFAFVDFCEEARRTPGTELAEAARKIQRHEMRLLLEWTFDDATGA